MFKRRGEALKESAYFALCCPGRKKGTTHVVDLSKRTEQHVNWENIKTTGNYIYEHKSGAPNENILQNHLNIALLNVF